MNCSIQGNNCIHKVYNTKLCRIELMSMSFDRHGDLKFISDIVQCP